MENWTFHKSGYSKMDDLYIIHNPNKIDVPPNLGNTHMMSQKNKATCAFGLVLASCLSYYAILRPHRHSHGVPDRRHEKLPSNYGLRRLSHQGALLVWLQMDNRMHKTF